MSADLTVAEVAEQLRCSPRFVYDRLKDGSLAGTFVARWLIPAEAVEAFKAKRANRAPEPKPGRRRPRRNL